MHGQERSGRKTFLIATFLTIQPVPEQVYHGFYVSPSQHNWATGGPQLSQLSVW